MRDSYDKPEGMVIVWDGRDRGTLESLLKNVNQMRLSCHSPIHDLIQKLDDLDMVGVFYFVLMEGTASDTTDVVIDNPEKVFVYVDGDMVYARYRDERITDFFTILGTVKDAYDNVSSMVRSSGHLWTKHEEDFLL